MPDADADTQGAKDRTREERDALFDRHPPTGPRPSRGDYEAVARQIGRTIDAVGWTWEDANTAVRGLPSTASRRLKDYLREQGWLGPDE